MYISIFLNQIDFKLGIRNTNLFIACNRIWLTVILIYNEVRQKCHIILEILNNVNSVKCLAQGNKDLSLTWEFATSTC